MEGSFEACDVLLLIRDIHVWKSCDVEHDKTTKLMVQCAKANYTIPIPSIPFFDQQPSENVQRTTQQTTQRTKPQKPSWIRGLPLAALRSGGTPDFCPNHRHPRDNKDPHRGWELWVFFRIDFPGRYAAICFAVLAFFSSGCFPCLETVGYVGHRSPLWLRCFIHQNAMTFWKFGLPQLHRWWVWGMGRMLAMGDGCCRYLAAIWKAMGFSVILDVKCNEHRIFGWQGCESNAPFFSWKWIDHYDSQCLEVFGQEQLGFVGESQTMFLWSCSEGWIWMNLIRQSIASVATLDMRVACLNDFGCFHIILEAVSGFAFTLCGVETLNHCCPMGSICPWRKLYTRRGLGTCRLDCGIVDP